MSQGHRVLLRSYLVALLWSAVCVLETSAGFITAASYPAGGSPRSVVVADFNGDGIADLGVANSVGVSILLGNGDGTFRNSQSYTVGSFASSLVAGDFNGDGIPDLAVTGFDDHSNGTVSILLGKGDGTFLVGGSVQAGPSPNSAAVADFNGDGIADLAVANVNDTTVSILLGNGDGTFQLPVFYASGDSPTSLVVADFNGDGHPDIAVANGYGGGPVSILLGNGDGTFQAVQSYATTHMQPESVAVGDFNGDGIPDLVVVGLGSLGVSILLGKGDGTFQASRNYAVSSSLTSVVVADLDGDGNLDLAMTDDSGVSILLGKGDGTFQAAYGYAAGPVFSDALVGLFHLLAVGDFNGDGVPDLAVTDRPFSAPGTVTILLGKGHGTFQAARNYDAPGGGSSVALGDFNGDGITDLAVAVYNGVAIQLGNGDGTFQAPQLFPAGSGATSLAVADLNGDGIMDLVITNYAYTVDRQGIHILESDLHVLLGKGDGTLAPATVLTAGTGPVSVAVGDFNGDGIPDLAVANQGITSNDSSLSILLGNGDGTFQAAKDYPVGSFHPQSVAVGDFDGDGHLDLVVAGNGTVSLFLGNGDGTFRPAQDYGVGGSANYVVVADFNSDGHADLAVTTGSSVAILLGNGDGTFQPAQGYAAEGICVTVADFNRDGQLDLAVPDGGNGIVSILLGNGNGTFKPAQGYTVSLSSWAVAGDFNGDGFPDLAFTGSSTTVLLNAADWLP